MKKKVTLVIGIASITAIVIFSFLFVNFGPDVAIRKVESFLNQQLDAEIDVQKISINIWKQELGLHQVQINYKDKTPLAGCQTLNLSIALSSLWSDNIQIRHLRMNRPWINLSIDDKHPLTFQQVMPFFSLINQLMKKRIFARKQTPRTKSLLLESLELFDGALLLSKTASEQSIRLKQFMLHASSDHLKLSGILSFADKNQSEMQILKFNTSGRSSDDNLAQSVMTLLSSQSPDIFYNRFLDIVKKLRFQSDGNIQLSNTFFQKIDHLKNRISGKIVGSFELNAQTDAPVMQISTVFEGDHIENIPITNVRLRANLEDRLITINEIILKTSDSQVNIQGIIDLKQIFPQTILKQKESWKEIAWHFILDSNNFPLYHLHPKIPEMSRFTGQMKVSGKGLEPDSFRSELTINGQTGIPENICKLPEMSMQYQITAHAEPDLLSVHELTAQTEGMVLTAQGHINQQMIGKLSLQTSVSDNWLKAFGLPQLSADFHTALSMYRSISETKARMQLTGKQLAFNEYQLGDLNIDASLSLPGKLTIHKALLSQSLSEIETKGFLAWDEMSKMGGALPKDFDIAIHSSNLQLQDVHPGLSGKINIDGNIIGTQQKATGHISVDGQSLSLFGQRIKSIHFPAQVSFDGLHMQSGMIQIAEKEQMELDFTLDTNKDYQLKIDSNPIALSHSKGCIPEIQGKFKVDIHGKGNLNHPQFDGNIIVSPILFQNNPLPDAVFHINTADDMLQINCQSMLDCYAQYHLINGQFEMRAEAKKMPLAPVLACFGLSQFNGQVSGIFQMSGQLQNIWNAGGRIQIDHAALTYQRFPLAWMNNFNLIIHNKELTATNYIVHFPEKGFCKGTVSGKFPEQTFLTTNGTIPLAVMRQLTDNVSDIVGKVQFDGKIIQLLHAPRFEGQIRVIDGEFVNVWNNQRFHHMMGQVDAKDHILELKHFSFGVDDGKCDLKGKMIMDKSQLVQADLKGSASAIPIYIPDIADFMINAQIKYSRNHRKSRLTGHLEFLEGLYYQDLSVNQMLLERLQQKRRPDMLDRACALFPPICRTELDISIQSRLPLIADNDLAYMEIHPDLSIRGTLFNPVILGRTEMQNGEINYLGKTFVLKKGVVDFVNPYRTEPMVDIESTVTVHDWQLSLDVLGKPDGFQVKLSSEPSEEHADIISILLFGKPTHRLFVPDTGPYKSTQQMIAELLSSAFEDDIKNTTGLDTFRLEAYEHETIDDNQNDDYKITLGKELSRRMSVTYAFETRKGQLIHHTQANYKILENLIFRGMQDTQGTYGGELLLHMEFRQLPGF
jgi:hypothetical protein